MGNKETYLWIALLSIMAIFIVIVLIFLLLGKNFLNFNFIGGDSKILLEKNYEEPIKNILVEGVSADVFIKESEFNQVRVEILGGEKQIAESFIENETLSVSLRNKIFCFGFCYVKEKIIIYVPKEMQSNLKIKTVSGDIEVQNHSSMNVDLKTTSGDIKVGDINLATLSSISGNIILDSGKKIIATTTSGDIHIKRAEKKIESKSVSGDIQIQNLFIEEDSSIKTTSGDVSINETNDIFIEASTVSGEIDVLDNNRHVDRILRIKTTSGDISVK